MVAFFGVNYQVLTKHHNWHWPPTAPALPLIETEGIFTELPPVQVHTQASVDQIEALLKVHHHGHQEQDQECPKQWSRAASQELWIRDHSSLHHTATVKISLKRFFLLKFFSVPKGPSATYKPTWERANQTTFHR